jgi:hypothetical protein
MFSAMQISESAQGLVLTYPLSTGVVFLAVAALLTGYGLFGRRLIRRRSPVVLAGAVALAAASYFLTFRATLDDEAARVYAFLYADRAISWKDAADVYLERREGGDDWRIVVLDGRRRAFDFDVTHLSLEERHRVMAYMVDRVPAGVSSGTPALLERQAPYGPRRASVLSDQQI